MNLDMSTPRSSDPTSGEKEETGLRRYLSVSSVIYDHIIHTCCMYIEVVDEQKTRGLDV